MNECTACLPSHHDSAATGFLPEWRQAVPGAERMPGGSQRAPGWEAQGGLSDHAHTSSLAVRRTGISQLKATAGVFFLAIYGQNKTDSLNIATPAKEAATDGQQPTTARAPNPYTYDALEGSRSDTSTSRRSWHPPFRLVCHFEEDGVLHHMCLMHR